MNKEFLFYVKLFGLKEQLTQNELKPAYRQNAEDYHPDKYVNAPAHAKQHTLDIMQQINGVHEYSKIITGESMKLQNFTQLNLKVEMRQKNVHYDSNNIETNNMNNKFDYFFGKRLERCSFEKMKNPGASSWVSKISP
jgi:DnaJ-class molecular chaperone